MVLSAAERRSTESREQLVFLARVMHELALPYRVLAQKQGEAAAPLVAPPPCCFTILDPPHHPYVSKEVAHEAGGADGGA